MRESKQTKRSRKLTRIALISAIILIVLTAAVLLLRRMVSRSFAANGSDEVLSAQVTAGSISTTVSGSGTLQDQDVEELEIYSTVETDDVLVQAGDRIEEGDVLATVDMTTVITAMADLQSQLDEVDAEISDASANMADTYISSSVEGRVKTIYAGSGDDVASVMYEHGALMELSLDGYMAVSIPSGTLSAGEQVYVDTAEGARYYGAVDEADGDDATVLISDDGPADGESVTVSLPDGTALGGGELYIHRPLSITGYTGSVYLVYVEENSPVYIGSVLLYLSDTGYTAAYGSLLKERADLEELLQQLIVIYKEGAVLAHMSGSVTAISSDSGTSTGTASSSNTAASSGSYSGSSGSASTAAVSTQSTETESADTKVLMTICPNQTMTVSISVDESNILSLELGQEAQITVDSIGEDVFAGTVTEIERAGGSSSNGVTSYTAEITLDKNASMLSGMSADVTIKIEGVDNALLIPSDALHQTSTSSYVYTSYDPETGEYGGMTEVSAGLNNGSFVEISSGLQEGDTVYYVEAAEDSFSFGGMPGGMGGGMPSGGMPGGGGGMPSGGMQGGGGMPGGGMRG